jgi:hypothetical protein
MPAAAQFEVERGPPFPHHLRLSHRSGLDFSEVRILSQLHVRWMGRAKLLAFENFPKTAYGPSFPKPLKAG